MSGKIEFSVVIPSFNRRNVIARAVDSVLAQTHAAKEVIVVDDGSTDGTAEFLELRYGHVMSFRCVRQDNMGVGRARNRGVEEATSAWVLFLDSDDEWFPWRIERIAEAIRHHPELDAVSTSMVMDDGDRPEAPPEGAPKPRFFSLDELLLEHGTFIAMGMRRQRFRELGGFARNISEDHELMLELLAKGGTLGVIPEPLGVMHTEDSHDSDGADEWFQDLVLFWQQKFTQYGLGWRKRRLAISSLLVECSIVLMEKGYKGLSTDYLLRSFLAVPLPLELPRYGRWLRYKRLLWTLARTMRLARSRT